MTRAWRASWRVSLRMARRDVRRHRGRSVAVLLMVGVPTLLICLGLIVGATGQISDREGIPLTMGPAQASVTVGGEHRVAQLADPNRGLAESDRPARQIPGLGTADGPATGARAVSELTGAEALPWAEGRTRVRVGDRDLDLESLSVNGPERMNGKIELTSGRWPQSPDEVLVSAPAHGRGVPSTGGVELADGSRTLTVVGTTRALTSWGSTYELVTIDPDVLRETYSSGWFLMGEDPVTWSDVRRLNEYGLAVTSAAVLTDPPGPDEIPAELAWTDEQSNDVQVVTLGATLLLLVITLLVGPAFAVGATRARRTLALTASNGATAAQLRRTVLAQALVLGGLSAIIGAALSVPLARLAILAMRDHSPLGPFDVPWWQLGAIVTIALLASVIAALVPAQRLTRLDIVAAMRGRVVTPPPSRWLVVLGLVLAGVGATGVLTGLRRSETTIALATVLLVLGVLLLVPRILHALGHGAGPLPLPLRFALRDLARHRGRSAPTVAALLAGTAALTVGLVGATSDDAQQARDHEQETIIGEAVMYVGRDDATPADQIRRAHPGLVVTPVRHVGDMYSEAEWTPFVSVLPPGCTTTKALAPDGGRCSTLAPDAPAGITLLPQEEIIRRFDLRGDEARTVTEGGGVLLTGGPLDGISSDDRVTVATGELTRNAETGEIADSREVTTTEVGVVTRPSTKDSRGRTLQAALLLPSELASRQGWESTITGHLAHDPAGPIDTTTEERLQQALGETAWINVERGWQNPLRILVAALIAIFALVLVVVTLTATALSTAEQERDLATIAAVGGDRRTRRLMVASQTWLLAVLGVLLGVAVGVIPGITIARALTSGSQDILTGEVLGGTTVIPWADLGILVLAVPALAAVAAGVLIRSSPDATRRTE